VGTALLRANGVEEEVKLKVKSTAKTVRAYRPDEIRALLAASNADDTFYF
jgi:hypothetical protein